MRIGIDARFITHPQRGGFRTYTENLVRAMQEVDEINQFYVYIDRPLPEPNPPANHRWAYRVVPGAFPLFGMPLREQILLRQQIKVDRPDIVHFLCNTATVGVNGKYVVTLHDTIQVTSNNPFSLFRNLSGYKNWAVLAYSKWTITQSVRKADQILTVSEYEKEQIIRQLEIDPDRISVIHLAPNPIFKPARQDEKNLWRSQLPMKFGIKNKFILGVGYEPRKNIHILVKAFAKIAPEFENLDLVIVCAEKNRRTYFENLVSKFNLERRVVILDSLPARELVILYSLAESFVYPSERESFGLPPLEAISCGTPTIAMNITSMPEVLGEGALLVDEKDASAWINAIRTVLTNEDLRTRLVDQGLRQALTFSWKKCAIQTIQIYLDLFSRGK